MSKFDGAVIHLRRGNYDVRIDRQTPWGNPFRMSGEAARQEVIDQFEEWARTDPSPRAEWIRDHVHELHGKVLGCWCAPKPCHGDVLLRMAAEAQGGVAESG